MASLLNWLGGAAKGVERQINPFDNGATYKNAAPAPAPPRPVQQQAPPPAQDHPNAIAKFISNIPNTKLTDLTDLYNILQPNKAPSAPVTLGGLSHHIPILAQAESFAQKQAQNPHQSIATGEKQLLTGVAKTGAHYAPYVAPTELPILKAGEGAGLLSNLGAKAVNTFVPAAATSIATSPLTGTTNPKQILKNAFEAGTFNAATSELPLVAGAAKDVYKGSPILSAERGSVPIPGASKTPLPPTPIERGFTTTLKNSPNTSGALKTAIKATDNTYAAPRNTQALYDQAKGLVKSDIVTAKEHALNGTDDSAVATAQALIDHYQKTGDVVHANELASQAAINLTEHGRAVQAASIWGRLDPEGILRYTNQKIQKSGGTKIDDAMAAKLLDQAKQVKGMAEGRDKLIAQGKLQQAIAAQIPSSNTDKALSIWKAGLLTGPKTISKIALSNPLMASLETAKDYPAALIDKVLSLKSGERTLTAPGVRQAEAYASGAKHGLADASTYIKTGVKLPNSSGFGVGEFAQHGANFSKTTRGKILSAYTQAPGRAHGAISMPFFEGKFSQSLTQQAEAEAKNQGLKGAEKSSFIKNFTENPTAKASDRASKDAQFATLQQKTALGSAASSLQQKLGPVGQVIAPFTRIPGAVATDLINYSPAGYLKAAIDNIGKGKFDQRDLSQALGRATTGTGILALGAALMNAGRMTGEFPTNRDEQDQWQLEGKQANSIKVGGKWLSIGALGPAGQALLTGGQAASGLKQGGIAGAAQQGSAGAVKSVTDQPYLTGISGAINAINTPSQAKSFYDQTAGSIIPTGLAQVAAATDPKQRVTSVASVPQSALNAITNRIPGLREKNVVQQNVFGQDQARQNGPATTLLNPLNPTTAKGGDSLTQELGRLYGTQTVDGKPNTTISQITTKYTYKDANGKTVTVSPQDRYHFIAQSGPKIQTALSQLIQSPAYQGMDDTGKSAAIGKIVTAERGAQKITQLGQPTKSLTADEKTILAGGIPTAATALGISTKIDPASQKLLTDYNAASDKTGFKTANEYKLAVANYQNDVANGKIKSGSPQDFTTRENLGKLAITSQYSADVNALYAMSKANRTAALQQSPQLQALMPQVSQLSSQLKGADFTSTDKIAGSSGTKTKKAPAPHRYSSASSNAAFNKLVKGTHLSTPHFKTAKTKAVKIKIPKVPKTIKVIKPKVA